MKTSLQSLMISALMATASFAQSPAKVTLNVADQPISVVLTSIATQTGQTVRLAPGIDKKVTVSLSGVGLNDALDAVSNAAGLRWRKIYAPHNASNDRIQQSVKLLDSSSVMVLSEGENGQPAAGVVTGQTAANLVAQRTALGLDPVYWVYSKAAPAGSAADDKTREGAPMEYAASEVYAAVTQWLSQLQPLDALSVIQSVEREVALSLSPGQFAQIYGYGDVGYSNAPSRGPFSMPIPGRVRTFTPGGGGMDFTPVWQYGW